MDLNDELFEEITKCTDKGEALFDKGNFKAAIEEYKKAFELIPEPKTDWDASVWTLAAIGDSHFMLKEYAEALECFRSLAEEYEETENPFVLLRYGECLYETGDLLNAKEQLFAAYQLEGKEIFDNRKYLAIIADRIK
ncbi:MAG: tetratricopeptide repeat protein [Saccharofermentans sp.]|nr:tetratricopeptide repeat protein [Saccharofermentans sp.]